MKISELPTPRLRARAMELAIRSQTVPPGSDAGNLPLDGAFNWSKTTERHNFWSDCFHGDYDKAKELQPDLFKPMDGKPHIKLWSCLPNEYTLLVDNYVDGYDLGDLSAYDKAIDYCVEVTPGYYATIQEAVDALYSYRREV